MLFKKKTVSEKIEHLVKKNDFYVLADYVHGTKEEKLNKIPKEDEKVREEISRTVQELHHRS